MSRVSNAYAGVHCGALLYINNMTSSHLDRYFTIQQFQNTFHTAFIPPITQPLSYIKCARPTKASKSVRGTPALPHYAHGGVLPTPITPKRVGSGVREHWTGRGELHPMLQGKSFQSSGPVFGEKSSTAHGQCCGIPAPRQARRLPSRMQRGSGQRGTLFSLRALEKSASETQGSLDRWPPCMCQAIGQ